MGGGLGGEVVPELAWLRRSCEEQGVPEFVEDPATIAKVVALFRAGRADRLAREARVGRPSRPQDPALPPRHAEQSGSGGDE